MKTIKEGKTYWVKEFVILGLPDLEKAKVLFIKEVNKRKIVRYRTGFFPFFLYKDMYFDDFIKIVELK